MTSTQYQYVETMTQLQTAIEVCRSAEVIAVDTEFARFNTYYPIVGLIQIGTSETCFLIDPLAIDDLSPLKLILAEPGILKVFHACSEDLEVFQHSLGFIPTPVYDTQIAAAVLGVGFSMGYQSLVEHYLGISLPKDQTRSDWLRRPLSQYQLRYAALDVIHLLQVYEEQSELLSVADKGSWIEEEFAALGRDIPTMVDPQLAYQRIKGLWQLDRRQLNQLRSLCTWREETARLEDIPRNRIADQKVLMTIVRKNLMDRHRLQQYANMTHRQLRKFGDQIVDVLRVADQMAEDFFPDLISRDETPVSSSTLKRLKKVVDEKAAALSVAPELLIKRRHLEKLIRSSDGQGNYQLPEELLGWRAKVIGEDLLEVLAE